MRRSCMIYLFLRFLRDLKSGPDVDLRRKNGDK